MNNPADLFTNHLTREKMHRALRFMSAEFREGRPSAAPQRKEYNKNLGEDMEWQTADAVREEFDDYEAELILMEESRDESDMQGMEELFSMEEPWAAAMREVEELHSMEEPWAADNDCTDTTLGFTDHNDGTVLS